jgi:hypothetical protein
MNIKTLVAATALCVTSLSTQAGVVYEWQSVNSANPTPFKLHIEFDDDVVRSESISETIWGTGMVNPTSSLISLEVGPFYYAPRTRPMFIWEDVELSLTFGSDGLLRGRMALTNSQGHLWLASQGDIFTVTAADNDSSTFHCPIDAPHPCFGAAGVIRQVPEPGSLSLIGLGIAVFAGLRRRRAK